MRLSACMPALLWKNQGGVRPQIRVGPVRVSNCGGDECRQIFDAVFASTGGATADGLAQLPTDGSCTQQSSAKHGAVSRMKMTKGLELRIGPLWQKRPAPTSHTQARSAMALPDPFVQSVRWRSASSVFPGGRRNASHAHLPRSACGILRSLPFTKTGEIPVTETPSHQARCRPTAMGRTHQGRKDCPGYLKTTRDSWAAGNSTSPNADCPLKLPATANVKSADFPSFKVTVV